MKNSLLDISDPDEGNRPAVCEAGVWYTYFDIKSDVLLLKKMLLDLDIRAGQRVALAIPGSYFWVCLSLVCEELSLHQILLPVGATLHEWSVLCQQTVPDIIVSPSVNQMTFLSQSKVQLLNFKSQEYLLSFVESVAKKEELPASSTIVFTSGVTGTNKAVVLTPENFSSNICDSIVPLKLDKDMIALATQPFHHVSALRLVKTVFMLRARLHILQTPVLPDFVNKYVSDHSITYLSTTPLILRSLLERGAFTERYPMRALSKMTCGGNSCPLSVKQLLLERKKDIELYILYGLSECTSLVSVLDYRKVMTENGLGVPLSSFEYKITPQGELLLRGPAVMYGYLNSPPFIKEGRLPTGDFVQEEKDELVFKGRIKDIIIRGGKNISPLEIEDVIRECQGVNEVAVVGRDDGEVDNETIIAYLILSDSADIDLIKNETRMKLSPIKCPKIWTIVSELPKTLTGKIDRKKLKEII